MCYIWPVGLIVYFIFSRFVSVSTFHALVHSKTASLLETLHQSAGRFPFCAFDQQSTAWIDPDSWTWPAYTKLGLLFIVVFVFLPDISPCPWFVVGDYICLLYSAQSESEQGKDVTLRSEECAPERWTCCLGYFSFFLAAGVQRVQFAVKVMLLLLHSPRGGCYPAVYRSVASI